MSYKNCEVKRVVFHTKTHIYITGSQEEIIFLEKRLQEGGVTKYEVVLNDEGILLLVIRMSPHALGTIQWYVAGLAL